jgi:hypothetical protein
MEDKTLKGLHVALLDIDLVRQVLSSSYHLCWLVDIERYALIFRIFICFLS